MLLMCYHTLLFADDSNVFLSNKDPKLLLEQLNRELISVHDWVCANGLSLNLEKTRCMIFSNSIAASLGGDVLYLIIPQSKWLRS